MNRSSGTGSKFYEGGLSIGGSPGYGNDGGNVNFDSGNVYLEGTTDGAFSTLDFSGA